MLVLFGLLIVFSIILIVIGIIWFIVFMINKGRLRYPIILFAVGILLLISSSFGVYFGANLGAPVFNVKNEQDIESFYQALASGEDFQGESLTFTVGEIGSSRQRGLIGLEVLSTKESPITVLLYENGESQAIQSGDTVTVRIDSINNLAHLYILGATLE